VENLGPRRHSSARKQARARAGQTSAPVWLAITIKIKRSRRVDALPCGHARALQHAVKALDPYPPRRILKGMEGYCAVVYLGPADGRDADDITGAWASAIARARGST
jgi:hypothetical protein